MTCRTIERHPVPTLPTRHLLPAAAALLLATATGCGAGSGDRADGGAANGSAASRIEAVNQAMRETSFTATGTTTAFEGATQQTWWDPEQGFRMRISGSAPEHNGEMYCKDGTSYTSAPLFAAMLAQKGQRISVPERLEDTFVATETGDCTAYFAIAPSGEYAPGKDTVIDGTDALAIEVTAGGASDTYFVSGGAPDRLLRQEATRDGSTSTTEYGGYGEAVTVTVPSGEQSLTMDEFRGEVLPG